jgi:DNA helicase-2/ATP-dependent DNA helicase PcrA
MDMSKRFEAVAAAKDVLRRFKADHPTWKNDFLPIEQVISWLDCEIATFHPDDYPRGTYGFVEPGERLIWLCRDLPIALRRFTLAHELGHVVLQHSDDSANNLTLPTALTAGQLSDTDPCLREDVSAELDGLLVQQTAEDLLGPGFAYDPRSERELAANLFAAELLMPLERVRELYVKKHGSPDSLARQCGVSHAAMLNRLTGLLGRQAASPPPELATNDGQEKTDLHAPAEQVEASTRKAYDEFQQAAIETPTPALVVAGPGSGKTSTLIGRVEYLLEHQQVRSEQILALTFSRKAAQEMEERLRKTLPVRLPLPTISTFHAFCAELLRVHGQLVGLRPDFALVDEAEGYFLLQSLAKDLPLQHYQNLQRPTEPFQSFLQAISRAKDELITPEQYATLARQMYEQATSDEAREAAEKALEVAEIYALYQHGLEQLGDSDFGGLLMLAVQLLTEHSEVRAEMEQRYQHILVDEFQDINRASGVLLRLLAGEQRRVWVVGDANQAIYGFRGASPANISRFQEDYPDAVLLPLSRNYRSRPDIVSLADTFRGALLEPETQGSTVQSARASEHEPYIVLAQAPDEANELDGLVADIQQKLADGYNRRDIVVLCRTRAMTRKVVQALSAVDLAVSTRGGILEQEHIKDVLALLLLLAEASGMGMLRVTHSPEHLLSQADRETLLLEAWAQQTTILHLILQDTTPPQISAEGQQILTRLAIILTTLFHTNGHVWELLAAYLLVETSLVRDLLADPQSSQDSMVCEDYARLLQYARDYDRRQQAAQQRLEELAKEREEQPPSPPAIDEQVRDFLDYLQVLLSLRQESEGRQTASDEQIDDELRVMTVHASKGLEFPIVYLPGLTQRRFPLQRRANPTPLPAGMLSPESESEHAHESGEACLFYVGATRARDRLILSYSERAGKQKAKRSGYIDTLIVGLPNERVQRVIWHNQASAQTADTAQTAAQGWSTQPSQAFLQARQPRPLKASQIEEYQTCPRRYAYSTIYGFQRSEGAFLQFWQATSEMLKALVEQPAIANHEEAAMLFHRHWHEHGGNELPFAHLYQRHGQEIAARVWQSLQEKPTSNWQLRRELAVHIAGRTVQVSVDRIELPAQSEQPTTFVRNRFNHSKSKPTAGTRELLYLHAQRQHLARQPSALESHNLTTGARHEIKLTARKEESLFNELEQAIEGIEHQDFTPHPDARVCPACPFFLICPI